MQHKNYWLAAALLCIACQLAAHAPKNRLTGKKEAVSRGFCANSESAIDQEINNVRARLLGGGDCWWNLKDGRYIVPKVDPSSGQPEVSSIFAASVWLGGLDEGNNLKLACQDYRESGKNDFWPGPINEETHTTTEKDCANWDRHFRVTSDDIRLHLSHLASGNLNEDDIPKNIKGWPARANPYFAEIYNFPLPTSVSGLAGFYDRNGNNEYEPLDGDYPSIEIRDCAPYDKYPDEMIFWIYNDEGSKSPHGRSGGAPIRMEIQVQAFGYQTSDALNNMTFQRYKLINRAQSAIDSTFFAMWVDPDLGCHSDDYIGCDTANSLMYVYNQDETDGQPGCNCPSPTGEVPTYCNDVPILGVDYFRGPRKLVIVDGEEKMVEIGMSSFMYYNNPDYGTPNPATTDPQLPGEFYNYLTGSWRDGTRLTHGGSGYNPAGATLTNYALSDSPDDPTGWSMCTAALPFGDRRTLQASGPFRLEPGATNELIIGVPWVASANYPCPDIEQLLRADKLAQGLFNSCFDHLTGPDAPQVDWVELNRELVAVLSNNNVSNNINESYSQTDFLAPDSIKFSPDPAVRETANYRFEGYKIYQLINPTVSVEDFDNPDLSRLVYQMDKKNGISRIFNWVETVDPQYPDDPDKKFYYPVEQVNGADAGIRHALSITEDQFSKENIRTLINHKKYYFAVVAYAHNNYADFEMVGSLPSGQNRSYLEGGRVEIKTVIPRPAVDQVLHAAYGEPVEITRLEGAGAGHNFLGLTAESRKAMLEDDFNGEITYLPGQAPINVTIFNPYEVKDGEFELEFIDSNLNDNTVDANSGWRLQVKNEQGDLVLAGNSDFGIDQINEQIFAEYGISVSISQTPETGDLIPSTENPDIASPGELNGAIGASTIYGDPNELWVGGIADQLTGVFNFVPTGPSEKYSRLDPKSKLSQLGDGSFVPYPLLMDSLPSGALGASIFPRLMTPAWTGRLNGVYQNDRALGSLDSREPGNRFEKMRLLPNVDIVLTPDRTKWSRCVVIESASEYFTGFLPGVKRDSTLKTESPDDRVRQQFDTRYALSVGKEDNDNDGVPDHDDAVEPDSLPDPTVDNPHKKRANPLKGQPLRGMGWFPGYAVDVETGRRLNIFFGENSCFKKELDPNYTGRDMLWNPTDQVTRKENTVGDIADFVLGGQHWVYVTNTTYDECNYLRSRFNPDYWFSAFKILNKKQAIPQIAWAGMLSLANGYDMKPLKDGLIPWETIFQLRVDNPYQVSVNNGNGHPKYRIRIKGSASTELVKSEINPMLDSIKVVPNPYYAYSQYETGSTSNVVKITNVPAKATLTIYSLDGRFIRQYRQDAAYSPYNLIPNAIEWDLKNNKGIPVASGVYLMHIVAPGMGERTVKWFGVQRQFDPTGL